MFSITRTSWLYRFVAAVAFIGCIACSAAAQSDRTTTVQGLIAETPTTSYLTASFTAQFTALEAADRDTQELGSRTPLILIHGENGNAPRLPTTGCSRADLDFISPGILNAKAYWNDFVNYSYKTGGTLGATYKPYIFAYVSNKYSADIIAQGLRDRINEKGWQNRPIVLLAHSLGGLVARAYIQHHGGSTNVQRLITLGTPHHGSPGANGKSRDEITLSDWAHAVKISSKVFFNRTSPNNLRKCFPNPADLAFQLYASEEEQTGYVLPYTDASRSDLLWDNYDGAMNDSNPDINRWLSDLNRTWSDVPERLRNNTIAYYGYIDPNDPARLEMLHRITPTVFENFLNNLLSFELTKLIKEITKDLFPGSINTSGVFDKAKLTLILLLGYAAEGDFHEQLKVTNILLSEGLTRSAIVNDGLVPIRSAKFEGSGVSTKVFRGYDHLEMIDGKADDPWALFDSIKQDLSVDVIPPVTQITSPTAATSVSGTVSVTASATDSGGIARVEFLVDDVVRFTDYAAPFQWSWSTTTFSNGGHTLKARSYDLNSNVGTSNGLTVTVANGSDTKPPTITGVKAAAAGTTIKVTWTTDESATTQLEYGTLACPCAQKSVLDATLSIAHSVTLTGLAPGTIYFYRALSKDSTGNSGASGTSSVRTDTSGNVAPSAAIGFPNGGEVLTAGTTQTLRWGAVDDIAVTSVALSYSSDAGVTWNTIAQGISNSGTYSWVLPSVSSTQVKVRVVATDASGATGEDESDGTFTIQPACSVPSKPVIQGVSPANGNFTLVWSGAASSYVLQEDQNASFSGVSSPVFLSNSYLSVSGKRSGTYYYRIAGRNSCGQGDWSDTRQVTVSVNYGPSATVGVFPGEGAVDQARTTTVRWTATHAGGESLRYNVFLTLGDTFYALRMVSSGQTETSYTATDLPYNTVISWRIEAIDDTGDSQSSETLHFRTVKDTTVPSGTIQIENGASTTNSTSVTLNLSATNSGTPVRWMRFSNDGEHWSFWEGYSTVRGNWGLTDDKYGGTYKVGAFTVYAQFMTAENNVSPTVSDSIEKTQGVPGDVILRGKKYSTIRDAVADAVSGDTVYLTPGYYSIKGALEPTRYPTRYVGIVLKPGVTLQGAGASRTTIDMTSTGLWTVIDADDSAVRGLTLINSDTGGVRYAMKMESNRSTIEDCILKGSYGGILIGEGTGSFSGNRVANNIIIQNTEGLRIRDPASNAQIFNNVIASNQISGIASSGIAVDIANNIVYSNSQIGISASSGPVVRFNNVFGNGAVNYQTISDQTGINGNISSDPLFTSNYRLGPGSPSIDRGTNVGLPFSGAAPDMGAFETSATGTLRVQLNLASGKAEIGGDGTYTASGSTWTTTDVPVGTYFVIYKPVAGYYAPPFAIRSLKAGQTLTFDGQYTPDSVAPEGKLFVDYGGYSVSVLTVNLSLDVVDEVSDISTTGRMQFSNDGSSWSAAEAFSSLKSGWSLTGFGGSAANGQKIVYARVFDAVGNSRTLSATIAYTPAPRVLEVPAAYPNIQAAVDAATAGDIVLVAPGTYNGANVTLKEGIRLQGSGPSLTIVGGAPAITAAANTRIDGFTLRGFIGVSNPSTSVLITNVVFETTRGVQTPASSSTTIRNSVFNAGDYGLLSFGGTDQTVVIENCTFWAQRFAAIYVQDSRLSTRIFVRNSILGNSAGYGFHDNGSADPEHQHMFSAFNIFWRNNSGDFNGNSNNIFGPGDLERDPILVDPSAGKFGLASNSPAANSGDPSARFNDVDNTPNDRGAFGGPQSNTAPVARLTINRTTAGPGQDILYDARSSSDRETLGGLFFRWDWNGDGVFDTPFSPASALTYSFSDIGTKKTVLQARDSGWFLGTETASAEVNITNQNPLPPASESPVSGSEVEDNRTMLGWTGRDPDGDSVIYDIYFGTATDPPLVASDSTSNQFDPGVLVRSQFYNWKIVVKDPHGGLATGPVWTFSTGKEPLPSTPAGTSAVLIPPSTVKIQWQDASTNELGFKVERRLSTGTFEPKAITDPDTQEYSDAPVAPGEYFYRVRAFNGSGSSNASDEVRVLVEETTPTLTGIVPSSGTQGTSLSAIISGSNLGGATAVVFSGTGVTASILSGGTATSLPISMTIASDAALTQRTITVTTPDGTSTPFTGFTVNAPVPAITVINPTSGVQGSTLAATLTGTGS